MMMCDVKTNPGKHEALIGRVKASLHDDLIKEKSQWSPPLYLPHTQDTYVSIRDRDWLVVWLDEKCRLLHFNTDTLCLSITLLDRCVSLVRLRVKYVTCVAINCLYLAAKICEEDELVPSVSYMMSRCEVQCSRADMLRMERVLLDKLHWQPRLVTPLSFLWPLHALLLTIYRHHMIAAGSDKSGHQQLMLLTGRLVQLIKTSSLCVQLSPSQLVITLLTSELRRAGHLLPFYPPTVLLQMVQMTEDQLDCACQSVLTVLPAHLPCVFLSSADSPDAAGPVCKRRRRRNRMQSRSISRPAAKRQLTADSGGEDEYVADIRHLYTAAAAPSSPRQHATLSVHCDSCHRSYADALRHHPTHLPPVLPTA